MSQRQAAHNAKHSSAVRSSDSSFTTTLVFSAIALVVILLVGGYWMKKQRSEQVEIDRQAEVFENYRHSTRPARDAAKPELPASFVEAQRMREKLLNHPAVTPGQAFNAPGVQSTGVAIIDAIDQAKAPKH